MTRAYTRYDYVSLVASLDAWLSDGHKVIFTDIVAYLGVPPMTARRVLHLHRNPRKGYATNTRALVCEAGLGEEHHVWSYWISEDTDEIERHYGSLVGRGNTHLGTALEQLYRDYELCNKRSAHGRNIKRAIISTERAIMDIDLAMDEAQAA